MRSCALDRMTARDDVSPWPGLRSHGTKYGGNPMRNSIPKVEAVQRCLQAKIGYYSTGLLLQLGMLYGAVSHC